mgnify:CR=1 FL=1
MGFYQGIANPGGDYPDPGVDTISEKTPDPDSSISGSLSCHIRIIVLAQAVPCSGIFPDPCPGISGL